MESSAQSPHSAPGRSEDESLRELGGMAAEMLRAFARRWRFRIEAGRLGNHSLSESAGLVRRLEAAARLLEPDEPAPEARAALEETDERFRLLVDQVTDYAIFMLDADGKVASWNGGAERIKGYRAEEILGRDFSQFYPPEERTTDKPRRELEIAAREGRYTEEGIRVRKNGERFWASVVLTALRDANGRLRGYAKVTRDVTEMRNAVEALRQSEERMRIMVEAVRDYAIFMLDPEGNVTTWNAGAASIKGYSADEIIGKHFSVFYRPEDAAAGMPERELRIARSEGRYEEEGWRVRKDGRPLWVNVVLTAIRDERGELRGFAKVTRDLTERRRLEEEAREADRKMAEERTRALEAQLAVKVRDEFMSIAAHELRTPLTALHLKLHSVRDALSTGTVTPRVLERFDSAGRQVSRLAELIERLLDVSRIVGGRFEIRKETMDLAAVVREVAEDFLDPAQQAGCELRVRTPPSIEGVFDRPRIDQVVVNLLSNAIKYGGGRPIDVQLEADQDHVRLSIRDRGIGVAPADVERIFGRFERAVSESHYAGLGLGLYVARHIAVAHGGSIRVESVPGEGSTFIVELPR